MTRSYLRKQLNFLCEVFRPVQSRKYFRYIFSENKRDIAHRFRPAGNDYLVKTAPDLLERARYRFKARGAVPADRVCPLIFRYSRVEAYHARNVGCLDRLGDGPEYDLIGKIRLEVSHLQELADADSPQSLGGDIFKKRPCFNERRPYAFDYSYSSHIRCPQSYLYCRTFIDDLLSLDRRLYLYPAADLIGRNKDNLIKSDYGYGKDTVV